LGPGSGKEAAVGRPRRESTGAPELSDLSRLVTRTLAGLQHSADGPVLSSMIKRAILRKDPTFSESDYGFRAWGELMRHLETMGVVEFRPGAAEGDPSVDFPSDGGSEEQAFELLREVVSEIETRSGSPPLSGLKDHLRKRRPGFSEKDFGYAGFLQFAKAAAAKGLIDLEWDDDGEDYYLSAGAI